MNLQIQWYPLISIQFNKQLPCHLPNRNPRPSSPVPRAFPLRCRAAPEQRATARSRCGIRDLPCVQLGPSDGCTKASMAPMGVNIQPRGAHQGLTRTGSSQQPRRLPLEMLRYAEYMLSICPSRVAPRGLPSAWAGETHPPSRTSRPKAAVQPDRKSSSGDRKWSNKGYTQLHRWKIRISTNLITTN